MTTHSPSGSWREARPERPNTAGGAAGCGSCLGAAISFLAMFALVGVWGAALVRRGYAVGVDEVLDSTNPTAPTASFEVDDLVRKLDEWGARGTLIVVGVALLGVLLLWLSMRRSWQDMRATDRDLAATATSQFDVTMLRRRTTGRKWARRFAVPGAVLYFAPILLLPFADWAADRVRPVPSADWSADDVAEMVFVLPFGLFLLGAVLLVVGLGIRSFSATRMRAGDGLDRDSVIRSELAPLFSEIVYQHGWGINSDIVLGTHLIAPGTTYASNDYIAGVYHGTRFQQADVTVSTVTTRTYTDSDGDRRTRTETIVHFTGRWLVLELPKSVPSEVYILSRRFPGPDTRVMERTHPRVLVEDSTFNEHVSVHARNPHDAFYLLTPALIERLNALVGAHDDPITQGVGIFCHRNVMHIAVNGTDDAFERLFYGAQREQDVRDRVRRDISLITDLIDAAVPAR